MNKKKPIPQNRPAINRSHQMGAAFSRTPPQVGHLPLKSNGNKGGHCPCCLPLLLHTSKHFLHFFFTTELFLESAQAFAAIFQTCELDIISPFV